MTTDTAPMASDMRLIVYPTKDPDGAKRLFATLLGVEPYIDGAYFIGFRTDGLEVGLDPNATGGPICYWNVENIDASIEDLVASGATVAQEAQDVGGGMLVARIEDPNGNVVGLRQAS